MGAYQHTPLKEAPGQAQEGPRDDWSWGTQRNEDWSQVVEANPKSQSGDESHPREVPNLSPQKILSVLFP